MKYRLHSCSLLLAVSFPVLFACQENASGDPPASEGALANDTKVSLNDVSVLYPLPPAQKVSHLLGPHSKGEHGELLPRALYDRMPQLEVAREPNDTFDALRVVSLRFDPCFPGLGVASDADCKNQIRVVFQPLHIAGAEVTTDDAAVHVFYSLTRPQFTELVTDLVRLRDSNGGDHGASLGIHPILSAQGVDGAFAKGLAALVLKYAGSESLTRLTFMGLRARGNVWEWGGFDVQGGTLTTAKIPTLENARTQVLEDPAPFILGYQISSAPPIAAADSLSVLFNSENATREPKPNLEKAYAAALRIENPGKHSPDTIDCISCHVAAPLRSWAETKMGINAPNHPDRYTSASSLANPTKTAFGTTFRAFGYLFGDVVVSQRTVNETAAVVDYVNQKVFPR